MSAFACLCLPDLSETTEFYGIAPSTSSTTLRLRRRETFIHFGKQKIIKFMKKNKQKTNKNKQRCPRICCCLISSDAWNLGDHLLVRANALCFAVPVVVLVFPRLEVCTIVLKFLRFLYVFIVFICFLFVFFVLLIVFCLFFWFVYSCLFVLFGLFFVFLVCLFFLFFFVFFVVLVCLFFGLFFFVFFPTCQVRVVRFYLSCLLLLLLSSSSRRPPPLVVLLLSLSSSSRCPPRPPAQLRLAIHSVRCPDLNHDHPRPVFPAGPQPRPSTPSVPCRTLV